jgi:flagellum-specific ATP synthase
VVGINGNNCQVMPYEDIIGINSETKIYLRRSHHNSKVISMGYLGRVVDFQGNPIDGKGPIEGEKTTQSPSLVNPLIH